MTPEANAEIARLTAAATEPGSVEASIRAAMVWAYDDAAKICREFSGEFWDDYQGLSANECFSAAIKERLKP